MRFSWTSRGEQRGSFYVYDEAPEVPGLSGAGTVHHVAWATPMDEHAEWRGRVVSAGVDVTPIIDRYYFKSIYFREPSGVLFEIATLGPGFDVDEPLESLGERLALPPDYEHLRDKLAEGLDSAARPSGTKRGKREAEPDKRFLSALQESSRACREEVERHDPPRDHVSTHCGSPKSPRTSLRSPTARSRFG